MAVNKVIYGTTVLVDLTEDTVVAEKLADGLTAHKADGTLITGALKTVPLEPVEYDYNIGYVDNGTWKYENPTRTYTDIYEIVSGHSYVICLGNNVGTRFRAMTTATDIRTVSSGNVVGTMVVNQNNPVACASTQFVANVTGYLLVAKDNVGKQGVISYVLDKSLLP